MAAKQLSKNLLSRPCHINSVIHFVRGADPFQIKTVSGSLALSAHSEAGLPEINLLVIHSTTLLKAQTLLDQSQAYITEYLNSFCRQGPFGAIKLFCVFTCIYVYQ